MTRYIWDKEQREWVDSSGYTMTTGPQIIRDIEPYKTVAADVDGKRKVIGGRRQHREFLQRNGYREVGNDMPAPKERPIDTVKGHEIKRAIEQIRSRN